MNKKRAVGILLFAIVTIFLFTKGPLSRKLNSRGLKEFNENHYAVAAKCFSKAVLLKPRFLEARVNLVKTKLAMGLTGDAEENMEKLVRRFPRNPETLALKGRISVIRQDYDKAVKQLTEAIAGDSLLAGAYFYRGIALANLGMLKEAANDYLKTERLDKSNTEALRKGAIVYSRLDNFNAAIKNYNMILDLDPDNPQAWLERGNFKMKLEDYLGAAADFTTALTLNPGLAEAFYNRGRSLVQEDKFAEAIPDFQKSADMQYKSAAAYFYSGMAAYQMKKIMESRRYLEKSLEVDSRMEYSAKTNHMLGIICMLQQHNREAITFFNRSVELDTAFTDAFYNRGIAFGMMEEYQKAVEDLERSIALGNSSSDVHYALGIQLISLYRTEEGCRQLARAEELGHTDAALMRDRYCKQYIK